MRSYTIFNLGLTLSLFACGEPSPAGSAAGPSPGQLATNPAGATITGQSPTSAGGPLPSAVPSTPSGATASASQTSASTAASSVGAPTANAASVPPVFAATSQIQSTSVGGASSSGQSTVAPAAATPPPSMTGHNQPNGVANPTPAGYEHLLLPGSVDHVIVGIAVADDAIGSDGAGDQLKITSYKYAAGTDATLETVLTRAGIDYLSAGPPRLPLLVRGEAVYRPVMVRRESHRGTEETLTEAFAEGSDNSMPLIPIMTQAALTHIRDTALAPHRTVVRHLRQHDDS